VSRRRSGSFGCCAALRGRRKVLQRPTKRGMDRQLGATTPRADTTGSRALSSAWRQARDEKGDGERRRLYLYGRSAISRSAAHDETRRRHLYLTSVTNKTNGILFKFLNQKLHSAKAFHIPSTMSSSLSCNGNPLVDVRTGARHADGRLSGLWSRHDLKESTRGLWPLWFYSKLNRNKPTKTDRKIYLHGEYISPTRVKFAS
jgi:hypothetical protein